VDLARALRIRTSVWLEGTLALGAVVGAVLPFGLQYWRGYRNDPLDLGELLSVVYTVLPAIKWTCVGFLFWLLMGGRGCRLITRLCCFSVGLAVVLVVRFALPYPAHMYLYGFRDLMRDSADVSAIREWIESVNIPGEVAQVEEEEWPRCIRALRPRIVRSLDNERVVLIWGGGFGHWGLTVGKENMRTSPPHSELPGGGRSSALPVSPGAFVWAGP